MTESHKFPDRKIMGLFFPDVISVEIMQRSTGQTRVVSRQDLQEKLSPKFFDKMMGDVDLLGEYIDDKYHVRIHKQDRRL